jgi:hypothetical protein
MAWSLETMALMIMAMGCNITIDGEFYFSFSADEYKRIWHLPSLRLSVYAIPITE